MNMKQDKLINHKLLPEKTEKMNLVWIRQHGIQSNEAHQSISNTCETMTCTHLPESGGLVAI